MSEEKVAAKIDRKQAMDALIAFGKAFNKGDIDGILDCVTDDFVWRLGEGPETPDGKVLQGREAVRKELEERATRYKSMKFTETEVLFSDNKVVGQFRAIGEYADGTPIDLRGVDVYEFKDGKISLKDTYSKAIAKGGE